MGLTITIFYNGSNQNNAAVYLLYTEDANSVSNYTTVGLEKLLIETMGHEYHLKQYTFGYAEPFWRTIT